MGAVLSCTATPKSSCLENSGDIIIYDIQEGQRRRLELNLLQFRVMNLVLKNSASQTLHEFVLNELQDTRESNIVEHCCITEACKQNSTLAEPLPDDMHVIWRMMTTLGPA